MARIINQNNEVIATKNNNGNKKATVSKTSFIVGLALAIAAIAIIVVVILFVTSKSKEDDKKTKTPLLQYVENYTNNNKLNPKIKVLTGLSISTTGFEQEKFDECYILVYDVDWMTKNEIDSDLYKSYDKLDSYLTGKPTIDGTTIKGDPLLEAIQNCGKDIKFYILDINSISKSDSESPEYFKLRDKISFQSLKSPMLFHYIDSESYSGMDDPDLQIANGQTKSGEWGSIIKHEVNYLNKLTSNQEE